MTLSKNSWFYARILFWLVIAIPLPCFAHGHHHHSHEEIETIDLGEVRDGNIGTLINKAHHELEGEESQRPGIKGFLDRMGEKFNLVRAGLNHYRWVQIYGGDDQLKNKILDLALISAVAHPLEQFLAPVAITFGTSHSWPQPVLWTIGIVGAVTAVMPGLDPFCVGLFALYTLDPVQKVVTGTRLFLFRAASVVGSTLGIKWLARQLVEKNSLEQRLQNLHQDLWGKGFSTTVTNEPNSNEYLLAAEGQTFSMELTLVKGDSLFLKTARFFYSEGHPPEMKDLKRALKPLGFNISHALREGVRKFNQGRLDAYGRQFFVKKADTHSGELHFEFRDKALEIRPGYHLNQSTGIGKLCARILGRAG